MALAVKMLETKIHLFRYSLIRILPALHTCLPRLCINYNVIINTLCRFYSVPLKGSGCSIYQKQCCYHSNVVYHMISGLHLCTVSNTEPKLTNVTWSDKIALSPLSNF